jgi:cellulose synthase/poly-beta-1,6-N-acetylglucosamine synthase-like glycosyltransferase
MLFTILIFITLVLLFNYGYFIHRINAGLKRVFAGKSVPGSNSSSYISVIIPFRNESESILESLKSIEGQDFPKNKFEVIYVNDCSDDDSLEKIVNAEKSSNIKIISAPVSESQTARKKQAVKFAIDNSKGDIIVTTDCDCLHERKWLSSLISYFDDETAFISGPVTFIDESTFFNKFQKLEFAGLILSGAGLIGNHTPVICSAANLAYRKDIFIKVNGFEEDMSLSSGDDELLMQRISAETKMKIKFCKEPEAVVKTNQNKNVGSFVQQRRRWASKGLFYKNKMLIAKLIVVFLFYLELFSLPVIAVCFSKPVWIIFILSLIAKMFIEYPVMKKGSGFLFNKNLLKYFISAEVIQIPYIVAASVLGVIGNYTWKERKVKR